MEPVLFLTDDEFKKQLIENGFDENDDILFEDIFESTFTSKLFQFVFMAGQRKGRKDEHQTTLEIIKKY